MDAKLREVEAGEEVKPCAETMKIDAPMNIC